MKKINIIILLASLMLGSKGIMCQGNQPFKQAFKPIKSHIEDNEHLILVNKIKVKGNQLKLNGTLNEAYPLLMRGNVTFRCFLAGIDENKASIQCKLRSGSGENSEYLLSISTQENEKQFIHKDIHIEQTGKYWIETNYEGNDHGLGVIVLTAVKKE